MLRTFLKSKIHRATVTEANLDYEGSITIDGELADAADLWPNERVDATLPKPRWAAKPSSPAITRPRLRLAGTPIRSGSRLRTWPVPCGRRHSPRFSPSGCSCR